MKSQNSMKYHRIHDEISTEDALKTIHLKTHSFPELRSSFRFGTKDDLSERNGLYNVN